MEILLNKLWETDFSDRIGRAFISTASGEN